MVIERFEDILTWKHSRELTKLVYEIMKNCKDWGFRDQICRATVSIGNNIAEGFERKSNNELKHFLYIAKGSAGEVRNMLYTGLDLGYFTNEQNTILFEKVVTISKFLSNFIKKL